MSKEQNASRFSVRSGFFLGISTAAVLGALVIMGLQYGGGAKAAVTHPATQVIATPEATQTFPLAEHVAAMTESMGQPATTSPAATPQTSSSPAHSVLLSGTIELDKSIAGSVSGTTTVFVIARDKAGKGHPILAKRLDVTSFPTTFSLGPQDSMMGTPPPDHVSLEARIDLDRDAMTREPGAPSTKIDSVAIGSRNVKLTLKHSD
jgi:hypothetical protein